MSNPEQIHLHLTGSNPSGKFLCFKVWGFTILWKRLILRAKDTQSLSTECALELYLRVEHNLKYADDTVREAASAIRSRILSMLPCFLSAEALEQIIQDEVSKHVHSDHH